MKSSILFKEYTRLVSNNRWSLQQIVFLGTLISLVINYLSSGMVHQISGNPLVDQEIDPTYWLAMILRLPAIFRGTLAIVLDSILFLSCLASLFIPNQTYSTRIFFIAHFLFFILYNLYSGHHYINIGILIMSFPFVFKTNERFTAGFTFCRFLFCFMLFSAALWKIWRGNLTHFDQGSTLLLLQFKSLLFQESSFQYKTILFFAQNRMMGQLLWLGMIGIELLFFWGFITYKKDNWLLIGHLLFFAGGWFFFDLYFYENLLFLITLYPVLKGINNLKRKVLREKQHPTALSNLASGVPLPDERSSSRH
ncbi:hypothetical protein [Flavisolibacter tropicus]|uniref:HTTM domain-containing protein n=1 Tax=Flavisolibacter tropicus TaxID=1492898 RepID=A0A172TV60_9BACT|nr:hypothetical protein [Flavisolibacter tropicus]ANE50969.1 hypothetical protein SY85_11100 [Flavisolibacter tropicus]